MTGVENRPSLQVSFHISFLLRELLFLECLETSICLAMVMFPTSLKRSNNVMDFLLVGHGYLHVHVSMSVPSVKSHPPF